MTGLKRFEGLKDAVNFKPSNLFKPQTDLQSLTRYRDAGVLVLRLAFGFQLVKVSWQNAIFPRENLPEFERYLTSLGFPLPHVGVWLASYTEFLGGILLLLGLFTRWANVALIFNFTMALLFAHLAINDSYGNTMPSLNLVAVNAFLFLNGPGKYSLDALRARRK